MPRSCYAEIAILAQVQDSRFAPNSRQSNTEETTIAKKRIGELLVEEGLITSTQLAEALEAQKQRGGKTVQILISLGALDTESFVRFLAHQPGVASIDLENYDVSPETLQTVPRELIEKHEIFPIDKMGKRLTLGMACPLDAETIRNIEKISGLKVKPILCPAEDIQAAIARYYPSKLSEDDRPSYAKETSLGRVESALKLQRIGPLIRQIKSFPALPETVQRVEQAMQDPERAARDAAEILGSDMSMAAKVLSVANSSAYGFARTIDSLDLAVALLGLHETYSIVLSVGVVDLMSRERRAAWEALHRRSALCATAAGVVAKASGHARLPGVYAAGLLHEIGRVVLLSIAAQQHARIVDGLGGDDLLRAEEKEIGLTHTEAGYQLADHWGLPNGISQAIRMHHTPESATEDKELVAVVAVASAMAAGGDVLARFVADHGDTLGFLGLDADRIPALCEEAAAAGHTDG
ncbi:MAG: HDOD domain-containing protein [Nitrospiraceae bacterium]|nr:HDOD domain-containing protein [Nitrospiraceae bacterium]